MPRCSAVGCSNISAKGCGKTFHLFPKNVVRRQLWVTRMRREKFKPSDKAVVCSDHFEEIHFDKTGQTVRLHPDAVPTIFSFPNNYQKKAGNYKSPEKRQSAESNYQETPQTTQDKEINTTQPTHKE
ncbi:THAP domain-containing protein 2-like [Tachypleus tridentatus]|uniref:THAP domain-containing protein 2-like n=1 Tax=Tachypleus tridentatus TaxID=6853 RepID=UPI003FD683CF